MSPSEVMKPQPAVNNGNGMDSSDSILKAEDLILVTGASGFIGLRLVESLLNHGFRNLRCFTRPSSDLQRLKSIVRPYGQGPCVELLKGNLLSRGDCQAATRGVAVIYHLAAGRGEKVFADAFMNSVLTTRNLLEASFEHRCLRRFVNVSSFAVYSNAGRPRGGLLDESCPIEKNPEKRGDAYSFAKVKQEELVVAYGRRFDIPYVIVRPGYVFGPGNEAITNRVGIGTFGIFLHLGGSNQIPFSYVDNCAEAIVLAGMRPGVDGEVFNVVDDGLPTSRRFLKQYKRKVKRFRSLYVPRPVSYLLCYLWEKYSAWSERQLPPVYNRRLWHAVWKPARYSNQKLKRRLGWAPKVPPAEAFRRYFESCKQIQRHA